MAEQKAADASITSFQNLHSREFQGCKKKVHSVAWNCTGTKLASGSVDQTPRVWHIDPLSHGIVKVLELKGHTDSVDQLYWDPRHADLLATASRDKTVRLWDAPIHKTVALSTWAALKIGSSTPIWPLLVAAEHPFKGIFTGLPKPDGGEFEKFFSLPALNNPRIGP